MNRACFHAVNWFRLCVIAGLLQFSSPDVFPQTNSDKHPVPSAPRQTEIKKLLEETYGLKKADNPAKKEQAVQTLMAAVNGGELSKDETYVVLTTVISLSKDAGKFDSFSDAVRLLGKYFEGDSRQIKEKHLTQFLQDCKNSESLKLAIGEAIASAREDALENRFSESMSLLTSADSASKRLLAGGPVKLTITEAKKWTANRETQWKAFQKASDSLLKTPDDPESNWTVGRWHVSVDNNWKVGLPFLAKGNNAPWKAASELELKMSSDNASQIAVADAWWEIGQSDKSDAKAFVLKHAGEWYARA